MRRGVLDMSGCCLSPAQHSGLHFSTAYTDRIKEWKCSMSMMSTRLIYPVTHRTQLPNSLLSSPSTITINPTSLVFFFFL